jgi:quercetin dioxygenase-like cupin family protein
MKPSDSCALLLESTLELINSLEPDLPPVFCGARLDASRSSPARDGAASRSLAVLRVLERLVAPAQPAHRRLLERFQSAALELDWRQSYGQDLVERAFLENYAWTELIGPRAGPARGEFAVGLLLLGPDTCYPPHRHEAEEVYVPVSGAADWSRGAGPWARRAPGDLIHHAREEIHAMRTTADPLLALYLWRSRDLSQRASFVRSVA